MLKLHRIAALVCALCLMLSGTGFLVSADTGSYTIGVYDYKTGQYLVPVRTVSLSLGETALSALQQLEGSSCVVKGGYLEKAFDLAALENGSYSGWVYQVNGAFPSQNGSGVSAARYPIKPGDAVMWYYAVTKEQAGLSGNAATVAVGATTAGKTAPVTGNTTQQAHADTAVNYTAAKAETAATTTSVFGAESGNVEARKTEIVTESAAVSAQDGTATDPSEKEYAEFRRQAAAYLKGHAGNWTAFVLQKQGESCPPAVKSTVEAELDELSEQSTPSALLRGIWNGAALAYNPYDCRGKNLPAALFNGEVDRQGLAAVAYALIMLQNLPAMADSEPYQWGREQLVRTLLDGQKEDGSFSLTADATGDVDVTALVLCALSYEKEGSDGATAVERALDWLAAKQNADGSFSSSVAGIGANCESTAQVAIALSMLKRTGDTRFYKNGKSLLDVLLTYVNEDGGVAHIRGEASDSMATEQALMAFISWQDGRLYYVDLSDNAGSWWSVPRVITLVGALALAGLFIFICRYTDKRKKSLTQQGGSLK